MSASAAARQRRARERRARGVAVYQVDLPENDVIEALLRAGRLSEGEAYHRPMVEAAIASVLTEWSARWLKD